MKSLKDKLPGGDIFLSLLSALGSGKGDLRLMIRGALQRIMAEDGWVSRADYEALLARVARLEKGAKPAAATVKKAVKTPVKKAASKKR